MTLDAAPPLAAVDKAMRAACELIAASPARLWTELSESDLWREAVSCVLGSAVRHEQAEQGVRDLESAGVLHPWSHPKDRRKLEGEISRALSRSHGRSGYRFPQARANQIAGAVQSLYWSERSLSSILRDHPSPREARQVLAREVPGLGPKQASLFLRNTSFSMDVAILDCHVLRYMSWQGMPGVAEPPRTMSRYEFIESLLRADADRLGVALGELDRVIWLVMRVWRGTVH